MTIQVAIPAYGKSRAALQAILNSNPHDCAFYDPSPFPSSLGHFRADTVLPLSQFAVVMDPPTRHRFALVKRLANGSFKVA